MDSFTFRHIPASILLKSISGHYRPDRIPVGPITARYRFKQNAGWDMCELQKYRFLHSLICTVSLYDILLLHTLQTRTAMPWPTKACAPAVLGKILVYSYDRPCDRLFHDMVQSVVFFCSGFRVPLTPLLYFIAVLWLVMFH